MGLPQATSGTPASRSCSATGSPEWLETSSTPSTWPAVMYRVMRRRSSSVPASISRSGMSCPARAWVQPRSRTLKFGSSKNLSCGSVSRKPIESERPVISERACRFTT